MAARGNYLGQDKMDMQFAARETSRFTSKPEEQGVVAFGSHCLKMYSEMQDTIALSSGESEFYGIVKAATMGIAIKSTFKDPGLEVEV